MFRFSVYAKLVICLSLVVLMASCRFGDPDDMQPSFADVKRNIEYSFSVGLPFDGATPAPIDDNELDGLCMNWSDTESLAVFGEMFAFETDTLVGDAAKPKVLKLTYNALRDGKSDSINGVKVLNFDFTSWAYHGNGEANALPIPVLYPYRKALNAQGKALKAATKSIEYNFNGQDGTLEHLRDSVFLALGQGIGVVHNTQGVITTEGDDMVKLTPKFAIVRVALTCPAERLYTLRQYVNARSMSESVRYIEYITLANEDSTASPYNKVVLNLETGKVEPSANAQSRLVLSSNNAFTTLVDRPYDNYISLEEKGGSKISWGTCLYIAVPCTDNGKLDFDGRIEVDIRQRTNSFMLETYYGRLEPITLEEGHYYITSAVALSSSLEEVTERAEVIKIQ